MSDIREVPAPSSVDVPVPEMRGWQKPQRIGAVDDYADAEQCARHTSARVFGYLVQATLPVLEAYYSDLFHDACRLGALVGDWGYESPLEFFFSFDASGTNFITPPERPLLWSHRRQFTYKVKVERGGPGFSADTLSVSMARVEDD